MCVADSDETRIERVIRWTLEHDNCSKTGVEMMLHTQIVILNNMRLPS